MRILAIPILAAALLWAPVALAQDDDLGTKNVTQFLAGGVQAGGGLLNSGAIRDEVIRAGGPDLAYAPGGWVGVSGFGIQGRLVYGLEGHWFFGKQAKDIRYSGGRAVLSGGYAFLQGRGDLYATVGLGLGGVTATLPRQELSFEGLGDVVQIQLAYDRPVGNQWSTQQFLFGVRAGWLTSFDGTTFSGPYLQIFFGRTIFDEGPGFSCGSCGGM